MVAKRKKKPLYRDLFFQVIVAILLGVVVGYMYPSADCVPGLAEKMKPLGDGFIGLIKMMIAPIIFCTIVSGIAGMGDMKQVGRVGAKALLYFEVITTLALIIGWVLVEFLKPGSNMHIGISQCDMNAAKEQLSHISAPAHGFLMGMIPTTLVSALSGGEILQVLLVAIIFAAALSVLGPKGKDVVAIIDAFSIVLFKMVDIITLFAPIGAFGAMAFTVGKYGIASLKELGELVAIFYLTGALFVFCILAPILQFYCKLSTWKFLKYFREELLIVLGTSSSESVLPRMMEKLNLLGCSKPVVGLVIPTGYSFNLVGSSIYFTMGALFITYATHTPLTFGQELTLLGVLLLTSKGAAGVTGSAFLVLAATLTSMNLIPTENLNVGLALIFAVDRFMSTGRAIINLIGNGMATVVIAKWENELDYKQAREVLNAKVAPSFDPYHP